MSLENLDTVMTMLAALPDEAQERVIENMREYITNLQDEIKWNQTFNKTQPQLIKAARLAKQQIAQGKAKPMDYEQL